MLKIQVVSDLHLEFGDIFIDNVGDTDVLVLAGDICLAVDFSNRATKARAARYTDFFKRASDNFKDVIYVMGNHEHYHFDYQETAAALREALTPFPNVHFLDNEVITIGDVTFIGGTLWTNFNNGDPHAMMAAAWGMNDFVVVGNGPDNSRARTKALQPADVMVDHKKMMQLIDETTKNPGKYVVVGHHAPSSRSVDGRYRNSNLNDAYYSNLDEFIIDRPDIRLWCHGHMHGSNDYEVGETRIFANARGYHLREENPNFDPNKQITI